MKTIKKTLIFVLSACLSLALTACQSDGAKQSFTQNVDELNCEAAEKNVPANSMGHKILRQGQALPGSLAHYTLTGAGYVSDGVVYFGLALGMTMLYCSPGIIVALLDGNITNPCVSPPHGVLNSKDLMITSMGKNIRRSTQDWKCPDFTSLTANVREVAACYADRRTENDNEKAIQLLKNYRTNDDVLECLTMKEREQITEDLERIRAIDIRAAHFTK